MNDIVIQNFIFAESEDLSSLYYHTEIVEDTICSNQKSIVSLVTKSYDGYFNCFYAIPWIDYTPVRKVYACFRFYGFGNARVMRRNPQGVCRVYSEKKISANEEIEVEFLIHFTEEDRDCRFYLEIITQPHECLVLRAGVWQVRNHLNHEVRLDVIICTYRKFEFAEKNVRSLANYAPLDQQPVRILLVDNGSEIPFDAFDANRVTVIHQENVGGSGGFARGMMEAIRSKSTHVLLMDDDLEVHAESVYRVLQLYRFVHCRVSFGGAMFDLLKPTIMWESHVRIMGDDMSKLYSPTKCLEMSDPRNVDAMASLVPPGETGYCGWWFYACQVDSIQECGLPLPLFIKRDDEEFCMRLFAHGIPSVSLPGIGTWHEPFYAKPSIWTYYYAAYNQLVMASVRKLWKPDSVFAFMRRDILSALLRYDYGMAEMRLLAMEDFLSGPQELMTVRPQVRLDRILARAKHYRMQYLEEGDQPPWDYPSRFGVAFLFCYLLNGRKRPKFTRKILSLLGLDRKRVVVPHRRHAWYLGLIADEVVSLPAIGGAYRLFQRDTLREDMLLQRLCQVYERYQLTAVSVMSSFDDVQGHLTSLEFWREYLGID
jgi:galactofuranosylgalactofuranosylrhamnosyl-N-acetylglucosaminyl-diphospho-decaprenol beta-1,5/1,6-galactofuranosyltransferase